MSQENTTGEDRLIKAVFCVEDNLNDRDWSIFDFIEKFSREKGYSPNRREIMKGAGVASPAQVGRSLRKLRDARVLTYVDGISRSISVVRVSLTPKGMAAARELDGERQ
jgi:SOS-response transcriptional repressor LexA